MNPSHSDREECGESSLHEAIRSLLDKRTQAILIQDRRAAADVWPPVEADGPAAGAIFPGAFNPLHAGHRRLVAAAQSRLGLSVFFEISLHNVDKAPLTADQAQHRLHQFAPEDRVLLTRAATFETKAALFPRSVFLVGVDTVRRIGQSRYYRSPDHQALSYASLQQQRCRFLVFGREDGNTFLTLDDIRLPSALRALCDGVTETEFRMDISSSELRRPESME